MRETYLLPIWIDIECDDPNLAIEDINDEIVATFEQVGNIFEKRGDSISFEWTVTKRVGRKE